MKINGLTMHGSAVSGEKVNASETEHLARIEGTLARVYRRNGFEGVTSHTPLSALLASEDGLIEGEPENDERHEVRQQTFRETLRFIFADGPHPGHSMRRLYALARALEPELIAQMNGTDLAQIFGETRAAQSARVKMMFAPLLKKAGGKEVRLPFQKPASACRKMSAAQRGNQNRKGKKIAAAARAARRNEGDHRKP